MVEMLVMINCCLKSIAIIYTCGELAPNLWPISDSEGVSFSIGRVW